MTRKRNSTAANNFEVKRSMTEGQLENTPEEAASLVLPCIGTGFRLLNIPSHLLVKVFQKTTQKNRINAAQACRDLYGFLIDSQYNYNTLFSIKRWHQINVACHKDKIFLSIQSIDKVYSEYTLTIEQCGRIREYTFEFHAKDLSIDMTHFNQEFVDTIKPLLSRCFCLKMGKMPNSETGLLLTSMAKQVTVLQFDEIDDASALPKYVNQSQNISSIWFKRIPISGDDVLDFFQNSRRSMGKIVMGGAAVSGQKLIEFATNYSFLTVPCLITSDELRMTTADRMIIKNSWGIDIDRNTKMCTFRKHDFNIVFVTSLVTGIP